PAGRANRGGGRGPPPPPVGRLPMAADVGPLPRVIVGLGNPGTAYRGTRHHLGHRVVEEVATRLCARCRVRGPAHVAEGVWQGVPLQLAKLVSFMNVSGPVVARLLRVLDAHPDRLGRAGREPRLPGCD